jgi:hypothetical protein
MGSFLSKPKLLPESPKLISEYLEKRQTKTISVGPKIEVVVLPKEEEPKK